MNLLPRCDLRIHAIRLGNRRFTRFKKIRTNLIFDRIYTGEYIFGQFACADLLARKHIMQDMRRFFI